MMRFTVAGLAAIIASVSGIQTQADASAQWHAYGGYNPWAQASQGSWYGSGGIGYGDSKVNRLQRDISYLVKQNSALKTRLAEAEESIEALETEHEDPTHIADLVALVAELEELANANTMSIEANDVSITNTGATISMNEGDIMAVDTIAKQNNEKIEDNAALIAANMMLAGTTSDGIASVQAAGVVTSDELTMMVSALNASIATNSAKIATNMMGVSTNSAAIASAPTTDMLSSGIASLSMVSADPAFLSSLQAGISTNSAAVAANSAAIIPLSAGIASNMTGISNNTGLMAGTTAQISTNASQ